jgi:hypothetical protein
MEVRLLLFAILFWIGEGFDVPRVAQSSSCYFLSWPTKGFIISKIPTTIALDFL